MVNKLVILCVKILVGKRSYVHVYCLDRLSVFSSLLAIVVDSGEGLLPPTTHLLLLLSDLPDKHPHVVWRKSDLVLLLLVPVRCPILAFLSRVGGEVLRHYTKGIGVSEEGRLVLSGPLSIV